MGRVRKHVNLEETCWQPDDAIVLFVYMIFRLHMKGINKIAERSSYN